MKRRTLMAAFVLFLVMITLRVAAQGTSEANAQTTATTTAAAGSQQAAKPVDDQYLTPPLGMFRGITNAATCWLELPRCIVYDNAQVPVFGIIAGAGEGVCLTVYRALTSVIDIASFGFAGNAIYSKKYPGWFWEQAWVPPQK